MKKKPTLLVTIFLTILSLWGCQKPIPISSVNESCIRILAEIDMISPGRLSWSSDSSVLYVYSSDRIDVVSMDTHEITMTRTASDNAYILDINPLEQLYLESSDSVRFDIKGIDSGETMRSVTYPTYATSAIFSPDGQYLAIASGEVWQVDIFDIESGGVMDTLVGFETAAPVYGIQYSRDGQFLLYFARATLQPQDIATHEMGTAIFHEDFISTFTTSPDGAFLLSGAAGTIDGELKPLVYLWDRTDGTQVATLVLEPYVSSLDYTPDGKMIACGGANVIYFADAGTLELASTFETGLDHITALRFSPDGSLIAASDSSGKLILLGIP